MAEFASKGVAGTALGLGAGALGVELLRGGLGGLLGGVMGGGTGQCVPSENMPVNRYEAAQSARISELETEVKLRDANFFTTQQLNAFRTYVDDKFSAVSDALNAQAVHNAKTEGSFALAAHDLQSTKAELVGMIRNEAEKRCCGDNAIVNYANATFYPKQVADVTTGTTTTAQMIYNPIPACGCCGK